ncbi:glycosyltransferase family 4 protein [Microcoleus sp. B5-D4]|uniref:glycosyltransferase family 4 protein n=1 Tax=unclassified Microcoleus TaxID=2642155 RepID=UPI002FD051BF
MNQLTLLNEISANHFAVRFQQPFIENLFASTEPVAILVTPEYEGIFRNGGIGTYYATLSQKLAAEGAYIILIICQTQKQFHGESTVPHIRHIFSASEAEPILELQPVHLAILSQFKEWDWVESESYKILFFIQAIAAHFNKSPIYVEFPDLCGLGYRTIQAKRSGLLGKNCVTAVTMHSGQEWLNEAHEKYIIEGGNWFRNVYSYEQYSFENADLAFFLSYFMEAKVKSYGWKTSHAVHLPYCFHIVPPLDKNRPMLAKVSLNLKREQIPIVFFCRLEERKGLLTFIDALQQLGKKISQQIHLIFLGKNVPLHSVKLQPQDSQQYIQQELGGKFDYTILSDLFSQEAIALVHELAPAIVCLTSPQENFPNSSLEMGQLPVSLVVSDTGGFRETLNMIDRSNSVRWFEPGNSQSLACEIASAIAAYPETASLPQREFLEQVNQGLFNQRLDYMKSAFFQTSPSRNRSSNEDLSTSFLLGMTSVQEQVFLENYAQNEYYGKGEIIDLGCWLGSATISVAKGLEKNLKVTVKDKRIHAYDIFIWAPSYMDRCVKGTSLEGRYKQGDSFLDEFVRRISPWSHSISVYPGDVVKLGWNQRPIEYLFVDAMKSWELTKSIFLNFYHHLIPMTSLVHYNDFAHFYTAWIHLLIYKLRPYFKHHCNLYQAAVFQYINPLPIDTLLLNQDTPFSIFSYEDIERAFEYSIEIVIEELRPNIAAAKVMAFIHWGDLEQAKRELIQAREKFGNILEIPEVAKLLSRMGGEVDK